MTTEIEKQFFSVFKIPKIFKTIINTGDLDLNYVEIQAPTLKELYEKAQYDFNTPIYFSWFKRSKKWCEEYPQITDRILLELICICSQYGFYLTARDVKNLKLKVLKRLLQLKENLKNNYEHQGCHNAFVRKVRTLFEEG